MFTKKALPPPRRLILPQAQPRQSPAKALPKRRAPLAFWFFLVFCGCIWLIIESVSPHQPKSADPPKFYSNQSQQDLRLTLVDAIRKDRTPAIDGHEGRKSVEIILAIYKAAQTGKKVTLPLASDPKLAAV